MFDIIETANLELQTGILLFSTENVEGKLKNCPTCSLSRQEFYLICGFSVVGEEDALMRRTGLGHGYGGGTSCLVKGSYCRCNTLKELFSCF